MKKIFFSYCWDDKKALKFIEKFVKENNLKEEDYFLDKKNNMPGDHYWENIKNELKKSDYFIYFNSINYYNSSACCKEYIWALTLWQNQSNIKLIEVKMDKKTKLYTNSKDRVYCEFIPEEKLFNNLTKLLSLKIDKKSGSKNKNISKKELIKIIEEENRYWNRINIEFKPLENIDYIYFLLENKEYSYINFSLNKKNTFFNLMSAGLLDHNNNFKLIFSGETLKKDGKNYSIWINKNKLNLNKNDNYELVISNSNFLNNLICYFGFLKNKNEIKNCKSYKIVFDK